jgi:3-hydroxybutyrate dehydrogenase
MQRVEERHALVTGGGRGIGRAVAQRLAATGMRVTILGRDEKALARAVEEGAAHAFVRADVTDAGQVDRAVAEAREAGPIGILVANAGSAETAPFARSTPDLFRRMFDLNCLGVVHAAQAVLPGMKDAGSGRIIAIASTAGLKGYPYVSAYCASKHAVIGLVKALALETASTGVTVNALCPGFADTDLVRDSLDAVVAKTGKPRDAVLAEYVKHNPQKRLIDPGEVADAVLWLCGEGARSVTGQAIAIAGGEV